MAFTPASCASEFRPALLPTNQIRTVTFATIELFEMKKDEKVTNKDAEYKKRMPGEHQWFSKLPVCAPHIITLPLILTPLPQSTILWPCHDRFDRRGFSCCLGFRRTILDSRNLHDNCRFFYCLFTLDIAWIFWTFSGYSNDLKCLKF